MPQVPDVEAYGSDFRVPIRKVHGFQMLRERLALTNEPGSRFSRPQMLRSTARLLCQPQTSFGMWWARLDQMSRRRSSMQTMSNSFRLSATLSARQPSIWSSEPWAKVAELVLTAGHVSGLLTGDNAKRRLKLIGLKKNLSESQNMPREKERDKCSEGPWVI